MKYYRIRDKILPVGTRRRKLAKLILRFPEIMSKSNIRKGVFYIRNYGFRTFLEKAKSKLKNIIYIEHLYHLWIEKNEPEEKDLEKQRNTKFNHEPKISIIVPTFNAPKQFLIDMIESVLNQTYSNWELCIADGGSKEPHVKEILETYANKDARIKVKFLSENRGIAGNSNEALSLATGDFITLLDHDDTLAPFALFAVVKAINEDTHIDFLYSDEDKTTEDGRTRLDPHFKPDWSPDMLRSYNYITHLSVFKRELIDKVGGFRKGYDGSQDYDLILRATEQAEQIAHIPKVLYHWRISGNSVAQSPHAKTYACESAKKALRDHVARIDLKGKIEDGLFLTSYQTKYELGGHPRVSIIIPNKDHVADLRSCVNSIVDKSTYRNYEILIVENNSSQQEVFKYYKQISKLNNMRVISWDNPFNYSSINNFAVKYAEGEFLLFLNNDVEVITNDWLERLIEHAQRKEVGAVGAKLYYPDNTVQHAGVIICVGGVAGHSHKHYPKGSFGYLGRLKIVQNLSAVTGACMMMRKHVFEDVSGFDEGFSHTFNDVDLCMKIRQKGYLIVWTPYAELYHYESKSRGYEDTPEKQERFRQEIERFQQRWKDQLKAGDPYYNPNLTLDKEDFSIKV